MSPIDPLGPLLAQIRARAAGLGRKGTDAARPGTDAAASAPAGGTTTLLGVVVAEVARLGPELPDRRRRAFRVYLEAVLTCELAIADPKAATYQDLVDRVLASMEGDGRLREAIDRAGDALLGMAER